MLGYSEAIEHLKKVYVPGAFLLINRQIISLYQMKSGEGRYLRFLSADTNDYQAMGNFTPEACCRAESISISDAVKLGWRACFSEEWNRKATPAMKKEYVKAIDRVIKDLPEEEKLKLLREIIMFRHR